ncbi:MAG: hypothetical protein KF819_25505 [Labilithrix sp.]|nr:hypothetical protein [Labilithrix sp.]
MAVSLVACAAPAGEAEDVSASEDELRTTYGDLFETLADADLDRWVDVRAKLAAGFDRICGDTICSGDYSNLTTARLRCSSTHATKKLRECAWILGGSIEYVDGRTGKITTDARAFTCKIPVGGTAKAMLDTLSASRDPLMTPLPATGTSFYDGLVACFSGVMGGPPPASEATFYAELDEWLWETDGDAAMSWSGTKRALVKGFHDVCGDTFCEGEYSDVEGLRFVCSVNRNSKRVARCSWSFVMADTSVDSRGRITTRAKTKTCNVEVGAQASALTAALKVDDPLHAKLPGRQTSIYDALVRCL